MMHFPLPAGHFSRRGPVLPLRVLIIDDSAFDRKWLMRMLHQTGIQIEVVQADTLAAMKAALDDLAFDIVFLDCHLPGSTLQEALENRPQTNCAKVLITGNEAPSALQNRGHMLLQKALISEDKLKICLLQWRSFVSPVFEVVEDLTGANLSAKHRTLH